MKELQSLCLDIRVLDKNGDEIELKDDEDDDSTVYTSETKETYVVDDDKLPSTVRATPSKTRTATPSSNCGGRVRCQ